jgi:hypothetical protein
MMNLPTTDPELLKKRIRKSLRKQGFVLRTHTFHAPHMDKQSIRDLNEVARQHRIEEARSTLGRFEAALLREFASGSEINPAAIKPVITEVQSKSRDELLFRYATLHWSIPVSSGYGRRLRFLVRDQQNGKLIGIIGLGDPVFSLGARDKWIGWDSSQRSLRLRNVLDAFVLGAVPPYRNLLCGKLIALLTTSEVVREAFRRKYRDSQSRIRMAEADARLALVTTTSALGRSSVYNRLKLDSRTVFQSVGYTKGYGEFHFSNGLYGSMHAYALENCEPTDKKTAWGDGFRNRREVIKKCLRSLDLPAQWLQHGIEREIFAVPLARNSREFLMGQHSRLLWYHDTADQLFEAFRERWLLPRAAWDRSYEAFEPDQMKILT